MLMATLGEGEICWWICPFIQATCPGGAKAVVPSQLLGLVQWAGAWLRPCFSFYLHGQVLITCLCRPASAPSPHSPSCPSLMRSCVIKSEKTTSLAPMPAQPALCPCQHHPVLQMMVLLGEAAGGADGGECNSAQRQLLIVLRFCVENCTALDETMDRITLT